MRSFFWVLFESNTLKFRHFELLTFVFQKVLAILQKAFLEIASNQVPILHRNLFLHGIVLPWKDRWTISLKAASAVADSRPSRGSGEEIEHDEGELEGEEIEIEGELFVHDGSQFDSDDIDDFADLEVTS